jgi:molybdate transport repressor ModE-like protein
MESHLESEPDIEYLKSKVGFGIKIWLEYNDNGRENILGSGWANLLEHIHNDGNKEKRSLTQVAEECGYSYKYAWNILKRIEKRTGKAPAVKHKGGEGGGGWVKLNKWGIYLLKTYKNLLVEIEAIENKLQKSFKID